MHALQCMTACYHKITCTSSLIHIHMHVTAWEPVFIIINIDVFITISQHTFHSQQNLQNIIIIIMVWHYLRSSSISWQNSFLACQNSASSVQNRSWENRRRSQDGLKTGHTSCIVICSAYRRAESNTVEQVHCVSAHDSRIISILTKMQSKLELTTISEECLNDKVCQRCHFQSSGALLILLSSGTGRARAPSRKGRGHLHQEHSQGECGKEALAKLEHDDLGYQITAAGDGFSLSSATKLSSASD